MMNKLVIFLIILLGLGSLNLVQAQDVVEGESMMEAMDETNTNQTEKITVEDFEDARETFLSNQTAQNRDAFNETAIDWADHILSNQLDYIYDQETFWFEQLRDKGGVESTWLEKEKNAIEGEKGLQFDLGNATTYAEAKTVIAASADNWQSVIKKIRQMRVRRAYDNLGLLVLQADAINTELVSEKNRLANSSENLPVDFWQDWQLVFDTYSVELDKTRNLLNTNRGNLEEPEAWEELNLDNEMWQAEVVEMNAVLEELKILDLLQTQALNEFYRLAASLETTQN